MRLTRWILAAGMLLAALPMFAGSLAVTTNPSCEPTYTHFTTIQAAVNAAPVSATTTIYICPGTYPEQITINGKKITLKGVAFNGSNAAIITPPASGLVQNATSIYGHLIYAQVFVENTTAGNVEDLTFDATGNNTVCGDDPVGIYYQNASGTITRNSVLNVQVIGGFGCQGGQGIYVESGFPGQPPVGVTNVTISYNIVQNYDKNGITANLQNTTAAITYNTVDGAGAVSDNAQNGIQLAFGATGSITNNNVDGDWYTVPGTAACGILVYQSQAPTISTNTVSNTNIGIYVGSGNPGDTNNATVNANVISATHEYDAIDMCANLGSLTANKINGADESGIHLDDECGDATVTGSATGNTISSACAAILVGPTASGTASPNTFYNVGTQVLSGSDTCTPPLGPMKGAVKSHRVVSPAGGPSKL